MGDVMGIADANGNEIAAYTYDDWGKAIEITGNEIANLNPIRYRGYYYDSETGYYYLQSRYYNPDWAQNTHHSSNLKMDTINYHASEY